MTSAELKHHWCALKPATPKPWLFLVAGLMWSAVGIMLNRLAYGWLQLPASQQAFLLAGAGLVLALMIYRFGFSKVVLKNIKRINRLPDRPCLFAFQEWKSYPLVLFMIGLGITLRHSFIPKPYLAVLYIGIGGGLFLAGLLYYKQLAGTIINKFFFPIIILMVLSLTIWLGIILGLRPYHNSSHTDTPTGLHNSPPKDATIVTPA